MTYQLTTDVLIIDSGLDAKSALERLATRPSAAVVLVRRQLVDGVSWHALSRGRVERKLADQSARVGELLELDATNQFDEIQLADVTFTEGELPNGVLIDGGTVIGLSENFESQALRAPRRGGGQPAAPPMAVPREAVAANGGDSGDSRDGAPWRADAVLESPDVVELGERFTLTVRVEEPLNAGSSDVEIDLAPAVEVVDIDVHLATSFKVIDPSNGVGRLSVIRETMAHQAVAFTLEVGDPPASYDPASGTWLERVQVLFSYEGRPVGQAGREILVNVAGSASSRRALEDVDLDEGAELEVSDAPVDRDVTVEIRTADSPASGDYTVTLVSRHLAAQPAPMKISLGMDATSFGTSLIEPLGEMVVGNTAYETVLGLGDLIANVLPAEFWDAIGAVVSAVAAERPGEAPDMVLLSDERQVPWELAMMPEPPDVTVPPLLGAQLNIGRWPLKPQMAGATELSIERVGVVVGFYELGSQVQPLPKAQEEAKLITKSYEAKMSTATDFGMDQALKGEMGTPAVQVDSLHFAGHGEQTENAQYSYLMLDNGQKFSEFALRVAQLPRDRDSFLFLNACQVGIGADRLGQAAGATGSAVHGGFRGVIAPLWSVTDETAKKVALEFYEAQSSGLSVGEYMRQARSRFREDDTGQADSTWVAYVFYGHPRLKLNGPARKAS